MAAAAASLEVVEDATEGSGRIAKAAIPALSWRGSSFTLTGCLTSKSSSTMNSADSMEDSTSIKGARVWRASALREIRGGRRDDVDSGGAEQ